MDVQTAPISEAALQEPLAKRSEALGWTILFFALTWAVYPNRRFADQTRLNQAGARRYTEALFQLLKDRPHALQ